MNIEDEIRAESARQLLDNETLLDTLAQLERDAVENLKGASLTDTLGLVTLTAKLQAVQSFREELASTIARGTEQPRSQRGFA